MAYAEVSTCRKNGLVTLGWWRLGLDKMVSMRMSRAFWQSGVHVKGCPFFVSATRGQAILAKLAMNGLW